MLEFVHGALSVRPTVGTARIVRTCNSVCTARHATVKRAPAHRGSLSNQDGLVEERPGFNASLPGTWGSSAHEERHLIPVAKLDDSLSVTEVVVARR